jgi:hypothetical protein
MTNNYIICFLFKCQALVEQYGDVAYSFILKELDPHEACRMLTLCSSSSLGSPKLSKVQNKPLTLLEPSFITILPFQYSSLRHS